MRERDRGREEEREQEREKERERNMYTMLASPDKQLFLSFKVTFLTLSSACLLATTISDMSWFNNSFSS